MSIRRYNSGHRAYERAVSIDKVNGPSEPGLCYRQYRWVAFVCGSGTCICWILCIVLLMGGYDEMTKRAYANYPGGTADERARRALLRHAMEKQGFVVNPDEWWHFDYKDWKLYPILNVRFEDLPI